MLNLVGSKDVKAVLDKDPRHQSAIEEKANELWKKQRASTSMLETVIKYMGRRLLTPGQTRWNSKYDALCCLRALMEDEKTRQVRFYIISTIL
jgi:hypothetical protein